MDLEGTIEQLESGKKLCGKLKLAKTHAECKSE